VFRLVLLRPRSSEFKELEIVVLRNQLAVLRRQTSRSQLTPTDRLFLLRESVASVIALAVVCGHA
jgi:hypothetical protein